MSENKIYSKHALCGDIEMLSVSESRYKTAGVAVSLILPLDKRHAAARALVPYVLKSSCSAFGNDLEMRQAMARMYGAELGVSVDRIGDCQQICISLIALDDRYTIGGEKLSERCAALLCDVLLRPHLENGVFRASDVEREKQLQKERLEAERNQKLNYALEKCMRLAGADEPSGVPPKGTPEEVMALTPADVYAAYVELLATAKIDVVAAGAMDFDALAALFSRELAKLERCPAAIPAQIVKAQGTGRREDERLPVVQTNIVTLYRLPEDIKREEAQLMSVCLGGSPASLLFRHVREELSLCYFCGCGHTRAKNQVFIYSGLPDDKLDEAMEAIDSQIKRVADGELTADDIEAARLTLSETLRSVGDSLGSVMRWYLMRILDPQPATPAEHEAVLAAVTPERIQAAAAALSADMTYIVRPAEQPAEQ